MNPYEYETTLDCRESNGVLRGIVQQQQQQHHNYSRNNTLSHVRGGNYQHSANYEFLPDGSGEEGN